MSEALAHPPRAKTWFAPLVLVGLASAGLASVASAKPWYTAAIDVKQFPGMQALDTRADMPLALALSLVALAAWGVVLVSRTIGRRIVFVLAAAAEIGVLAAVVTAVSTLPSQVREQLGTDAKGVTVSPTGWYAAAAVATAVCLVCVVLGWVLAPRWPSMSSRYDAPTGAAPEATALSQDDTDLWKALDAGLDPTDPPGPAGPVAP